MNSWQYRYDTGWINRTDWTNVHLGSNTTLNTDSNVTHNLNTTIDKLLIKVFVSTDGTDANAFELLGFEYGNLGWMPYYVDANNILIQTGSSGCSYLDSAGTATILDTENWYYKIKVYFLG